MTKGEIASYFPRLEVDKFELTSPRTATYNCIAYAAGDSHRIWWPIAEPTHSSDDAYWPDRIPADGTIGAFTRAFETLGYRVCESPEFEPGVEKVALFAHGDKVKHASIQLETGDWSSKLGRREDIRHQLHDLEGDEYGTVALILSRSRGVDHSPN